MKINKKIIMLSVSVLLVVFITGCAVSDYQKSVYTDEAKILSHADSYSFKSRTGNTLNGKASIKFGTFYGMDTLWYIDANEETSTSLEFDIKIQQGDFKVVFISPDNKVTTIAEGTKAGSKELKLQKGKSRIKIIGLNSKGELKMSVKDNSSIKIKQ